MRKTKTTWKKVQKQCDDLLTPIIKTMYPLCFLCGNITEVAHHHIHKSKSTALRYVIENLIPLCNKCHCKLHHNEGYWASKIVYMKGVKWFEGLELIKNRVMVKADVIWYSAQLGRLRSIFNDLGDLHKDI